MARFSLAAAATAALLSLPGASAFAPASVGNPRSSASPLARPPPVVAAPPSSVVVPVPSSRSSTSLSMIQEGDMAEFYKSVVIVLLFGGGLIPASIAANGAMFDKLKNKRKDKPNLTDEEKKTYLDPTFGQADYVERSDASGPTLSVSPFLFAAEDIPLSDVVAVLGRLDGVDSVADWRDLPSTRLKGVSATNPPMWLPRATFKDRVRRNKFAGWPLDSKGRPLGGPDLAASELKRVSSPNCLISDAALDAVFDTWAWGANIATPDKVAKQLNSWKGDDNSVVTWKFNLAAVSGRAITIAAALFFIALQVMAFGSLFVAPALRTFADVDIGFGELGTCDPEVCYRVFGN